jgi:hypothetical protein
MTRRLTILAAAALGLMLGAQHASALTQETRQCIKISKSSLKDCRRNAIDDCRKAFQAEFEGCFGPGAGCAAACSREQAACQDAEGGPAASLKTCTEDCNATFETAIDACRGKESPEARLDCSSTVRLDAFTCRQACQLRVQPALQVCGNLFSDCIQACASKPNPR